MGQVNFALGQVKIEVWWASEISLSSLVSLSETVSLINGNFQ